MARLDREAHPTTARCRVLIALLSRAFFESGPCLDEVMTARRNGVTILAVNLEPRDELPDTAAQWPAAVAKDVDPDAVAEAVKHLGKHNDFPANGCLPKLPSALIDLVAEVRRLLRIRKPWAVGSTLAQAAESAGSAAAARVADTGSARAGSALRLKRLSEQQYALYQELEAAGTDRLLVAVEPVERGRDDADSEEVVRGVSSNRGVSPWTSTTVCSPPIVAAGPTGEPHWPPT